MEEFFLPLMQMPHLPQFAVRFVRILLVCYDIFFDTLGRSYPFNIGVTFDDSEICAGTVAANTCEDDIQAANVPGGIIGFALGNFSF